MKNGKLINCKVCGAEVAKSAKNCPHCGANVGNNTGNFCEYCGGSLKG